MCDNASDIVEFDLRAAILKANKEYAESHARFIQKKIELNLMRDFNKKQMLRQEETEFELIRPSKGKPKIKTPTPKPEYDILFEKQGGICALCKLRFGKSRATIDHIIPKSKGGSNDISNKQLTHSWCNNVKADSEEILSPTQYMDLANERKEKFYAKRRSQLEKSHLQHQIINE